MSNLIEEFKYRFTLLNNLAYGESQARLAGFFAWMHEQPEIRHIIDGLLSNDATREMLENSGHNRPPQASTLEEVASVGVMLLKEIHDGADPFQLANRHGIRPDHSTNNVGDYVNALLTRIIEPTLNHILRQLPQDEPTQQPAAQASLSYPLEITESLQAFYRDNPDPRRTAFVMMQFGSTPMHESILTGIRSALSKYGISALRADDKEYHEDLFPNVLTYMHGCGFGIAVFERLEADDFNPNVSLEVGYLRALRKPVCLLKDQTLRALQTDLVGKLYRSFDPQDPKASIPKELIKWLSDKDIIN